MRAIVCLLGVLVWQPSRAADEDSPETKALLKGFYTDLKSKKVDDRVKAANAIGELGEKGKSARGALCEAMLDLSPKVKSAAADALEKIDKPVADAALAIMINAKIEAVKVAKDMGEKGEPLAPLILSMANQIVAGKLAPSSSRTAAEEMGICMEALVAIAPGDDRVGTAVINAILFNSPLRGFEKDGSAQVRAKAVSLVTGLKSAKLALRNLLAIATSSGESGPTRCSAVRALAEISDQNTEKTILKALESIRFDTNEAVRKTVDVAVAKITKK